MLLKNFLSFPSALSAASLNGRKDIVVYLLEQGASLHSVNLKSFTPLLCAVEVGKWDLVDLFLNLSCSIEQTDKHGRTPLMIAAYKGHIGVMELLLSRGLYVIKLFKLCTINEHRHEKTNIVVFEQVRHKPSCTSTEDG